MLGRYFPNFTYNIIIIIERKSNENTNIRRRLHQNFKTAFDVDLIRVVPCLYQVPALYIHRLLAQQTNPASHEFVYVFII